MIQSLIRLISRRHVTRVCRRAFSEGILTKQQAIILHAYLVDPYGVGLDGMPEDAKHLDDQISDPLGLIQ